jgi:cytochrome c oxidase cbb3-type subunit 1
LWLSVDEFGQLSFSFREIMAAMSSYYGLRLIAGLIFFAGTILMAWNFFMTMRGQKTIEVIPPPVAEKYRINPKPEVAADHIGTEVPA